jgi:hypothetical protein
MESRVESASQDLPHQHHSEGSKDVTLGGTSPDGLAEVDAVAVASAEGGAVEAGVKGALRV